MSYSVNENTTTTIRPSARGGEPYQTSNRAFYDIILKRII